MDIRVKGYLSRAENELVLANANFSISTIDDIKTKEREIRTLVKASKEVKCKNLLVITKDKEGEELISWFGVKRKIRFMPLWKWLLNKDF